MKVRKDPAFVYLRVEVLRISSNFLISFLFGTQLAHRARIFQIIFDWYATQVRERKIPKIKFLTQPQSN